VKCYVRTPWGCEPWYRDIYHECPDGVENAILDALAALDRPPTKVITWKCRIVVGGCIVSPRPTEILCPVCGARKARHLFTGVLFCLGCDSEQMEGWVRWQRDSTS